MSDYVIEAKNVSCKVGYKYLLKDISWQVKAGQRWVVFGMNGSGKTTLLSIIAGFRHYTEGTVEVFGAPLDNDQILSVRRRIGWVSASFFDKYYHKESVLDIVLSGKFGTLGVGEPITLADRQLAKRLLAELGLERRADYTFDMLSKGERQNVLIARALLPKPEILVLDEPCTGLDIYHREYLFQTLEQLAGSKRLSIIYVTHYLEEIKPIFDQALLLKNGHIFAAGATTELFTNERISEFLDRPVAITKDQQAMMQIQVLNVKPRLAEFLWENEGGMDDDRRFGWDDRSARCAGGNGCGQTSGNGLV